jgi:hypothetical protein
MEGANHSGHAHGAYLQLQDGVAYDDIMNNPASWTGNGDQFTYPQQPQENFPPYGNNQSYDHYDLSQPAPYQQAPSFTNSPYSSQYQHARPSEAFSPYGVDPTSSVTPYQSSFSFTPQESATIAPHSLQYHNQNISSNQPINRGASVVTQYQQQPASNYNQHPQESNAYFNNNLQTIQTNSMHNAPSAAYQVPDDSLGERPKPPPSPVQSTNPSYYTVNPLRTTHPDLLASKTTSSRPTLDYAPYVRWSDDPVQVAPGLKSQLNSFISEFPDRVPLVSL